MNSDGKLRIAFVADTLHGRIGGGVTSGHNVVAKLREAHDVLVVGADADGPGQMPGFTIPFTSQREQDFVMAFPRRRKLETLLAEVDVVHVQFPFLLGYAAVRIAKRLGKPVVAAFHVQPENALFNVGLRSRWLNQAIYRFWVRNLYDRADKVVVPTAFAEGKLREHGLTAPVAVVSNGIPPDIGGAPILERARSSEEPFVVLMTGRLAAEKRQEDLIEAVRRSRHEPEIQLVIAGAGPKLKKLTKLARGLSRPAEIGYLPRPRLLDYFHRADLFVHCSEVELEGIAVIEAMSAGLPVLVAQSSESAASGFALSDDFAFPVGNVAALADRIDRLVEHPETLRDARPRYLEAARRLDFGESVQKLSDLYRSLAGARPGVPNLRLAS